MGPAGCLRPATPSSSVPSKLSSPCLNAFHDSPPTPGTVWEGKKCLSLGNPSLSHTQLKKPAHSPTAQLSFHKVWALRRASVFFHPVLKEALKFTCSRKTGTRGGHMSDHRLNEHWPRAGTAGQQQFQRCRDYGRTRQGKWLSGSSHGSLFPRTFLGQMAHGAGLPHLAVMVQWVPSSPSNFFACLL